MSQGQLENFWAKKSNALVKSNYKLFTYDDIFEELKNWVDERSYIENSDINLLKVSNIKNNEIVWDIAKISVFPSKWKLEKWDLLITRKWTVWESSIFNKDWDFFASSEVFIIKLKNEVENTKINKNYISLFNNFNFIKKQFIDKCVWAIMPSISQPDLKSIKIPLPPLEIQNQIVEKMDFALIEKKRKEFEAKELLESIDNFVLNELWIEYSEIREEKKIFWLNLSELGETKRLDSFYNNPKFLELEKMLENGKYWVEKIWKVLNTNKNLENIEKYDFMNYIDLSCVSNKNWEIEEIKFLEKNDIPSRARQKIEKWDLLVSSLSWSLQSIWIIEFEKENLIWSTWFIVIKNSEKYFNYYIYALLKTKFYQNLLLQKTTWAIMSAISTSDFKSLNLPLPPLDIQEKIANEVKSRIEKAKVLEMEAREIYGRSKKEVEEMILG